MGIAPFVSRATLLGGERLEFMGGGQVGSDYLDVIARRGAENDVLASLARHLERGGAIVDLKQVRLTSSAAKGLVRALRRSGGSIRIARTHRCPFIDIGGRSWDAYLGSLGSEHRYGFRRKLKKLQSHHELKFESVSSEAKRAALVPVLFELHRLRWSEQGGSDGLDGLEAFHDCMTRIALGRGWLRLFVLSLDGAPAAAVYGFRYGRAFHFYQSGFHPRFRSAGVGVVALGLVIRSAIEEGAAEFDFLHGAEPYKFHWARQARRLGRLVAFPSGARGRLALVSAAVLDAARRVLHARPAGATPKDAQRLGSGGNVAQAR
jgi:hypothetical protein